MAAPAFAHNYCKRRHFSHNTGGVTWDPVKLAKAYSYPVGLTGAGKTIGIIELGGGFSQSDFDLYMKSLGLPTKAIEVVSVDGAQNAPDGPNGAEGEVCLDIDVCGGMAPGATLVVYFCQNTEESFVNGIDQIRKDGCDAGSCSWGALERSWQSIVAMNAALEGYASDGGSFNCAAGDNGSSDGGTGNNMDFPGSSPYSLDCGGTNLIQSGANYTETVWNNGTNGGATGGGVSAIFAQPAYQAAAFAFLNTKFRCGPDVAGVADPETGIPVMIGGQLYILGGTSAVAPQWAALSVLLAEGAGKKIGPLHPFLYGLPANSGCFRDITVGNNGTYLARAGADCCTGLGTPNGAQLLAHLKGGVVIPPPPPPPTGTTVFGSFTTTKDIPVGSVIHVTN